MHSQSGRPFRAGQAGQGQAHLKRPRIRRRHADRGNPTVCAGIDMRSRSFGEPALIKAQGCPQSHQDIRSAQQGARAIRRWPCPECTANSKLGWEIIVDFHADADFFNRRLHPFHGDPPLFTDGLWSVPSCLDTIAQARWRASVFFQVQATDPDRASFPSGSTFPCSGMNPRQFDLTPDRAGHLIAPLPRMADTPRRGLISEDPGHESAT